jgi:two-component system, cell cycle sensor histidine kinase and response regulator CckA
MITTVQRIWNHFRQALGGPDAGAVDRLAELAKAYEALQAEASELREANRRLRHLVTANPAVIFALKFEEGGVDLSWISDNNREFTGHDPEEVTSRAWWLDHVHPDDRERVIAAEAPFSGDRQTTEYRFRRKDGTYFWIRDEKTLIRDAAGQPLEMVGSLVNITDLKRTQEELLNQKTELRVIFDFIPAMIMVKDTKNGILRVNKRIAESLGKSIEEIEGRPIIEVYPTNAEKYYAEDLEVIHSKAPKLGIVESFRGKDGKDVWVRTNKVPYMNQEGEVIGVVVLAEDISEQRRAEEALRLLSSAVEQSKESILITDAQLDQPGPNIVFVNPAFTHMTGYTSEDVLGKTPRVLQGPRTDRDVLRRLRENLVRGEGFEGETVNYRKDGTEFHLDWQIAPIRDAGKTTTHFVAIQRDVTLRKEMEARSFQSQKLETVGKLAGGIAHEFNSIMTAIIGQSTLLLDDLPPGSPLRHNAAEIRKAADRAATLTRQLLAYGRKQILQPEILDLNSVVSGMENVLRHLAGRIVNLRIIPSDSLQSVKVDAGQIEQVIMNVVMNAIDAMPNGGKLTLETANATLDQEYASHFPELKAGEYAMLAITDTGSGMNQEVQARMFDPFFSTKGAGRGTGLGLATSYGILKQSGGHINVYSEPGRGATFKIYLPQVGPSPSRAADPVESTAMPGGRETIMLVEDDPALREMAGGLLERLGYTVWAAANGIEALSLTHLKGRGHIDLLFTDVVMPHMSGKELADRIRSLSSETIVLFTSAYTENAIVHQGVLDEGVELLQKPFTPLALARKVREMLDRQISKGHHAPQ